jgi:hypothetical protein
MQDWCNSKRRQVTPRVLLDHRPNHHEGQFSGYRREIDEQRCSQSPMTIESMVESALRVIARERTEFCRRYAAGGTVVIQGKLVRGAPCEDRKSEQQKEHTNRRPKPLSFAASDGPPIMFY